VHEQLTHLAAIDFAQPGVYPVEVLIDGEVAGAYPLFLLALLETGADGLGGDAAAGTPATITSAAIVPAAVPVGA
jgi:hypothetical protein